MEPDGNGAAYYRPVPDSGTLRLDVLTFALPPGGPPLDARLALESVARDTGTEVVSLPPDMAMIQDQRHFEEDGVQVVSFVWQLCIPRGQIFLSPVFSYTIMVTQLADPIFQSELAFVDAAIRQLQVLQPVVE